MEKHLFCLCAMVMAILAGCGVEDNQVPQEPLSASEENVNDVVCQVPVDVDGLHVYMNEHVSEAPVQGPQAIAVSSKDGSFWIADTVNSRLIHVSSDCAEISAILLEDVVGPVDLVATSDHLVVLSTSEPMVVKLSLDGEELGRSPVPLSLEEGLSGLRVGQHGEVIMEQMGVNGPQLLNEKGEWAPASSGSEWRGSKSNPSSGRINVAGSEIEISVPNNLSNLKFLGYAHDGSRYILVDEVSLVGALEVDLTVRRYSPQNELTGLARIPLHSQYGYVEHAVAVGPDGEVYTLLTKEDSLEIQQLNFVGELEPIIPLNSGSNPIEPLSSESGQSAEALTVSCVSRDTIMSRAAAYVNNGVYLDWPDIQNGNCDQRMPPRYFNAPGCYTSVSYAWGGFNTVSEFNAGMSGNTHRAGDINDAHESQLPCVRGVDCSGFVSRCWGLSDKQGTCGLRSYSTKLSSTNSLIRGDIMNKCKKHVVLFSSFSGSSGILCYEATTDGNKDRVDYMYRSFDTLRLIANEPRRYVSVCP